MIKKIIFFTIFSLLYFFNSAYGYEKEFNLKIVDDNNSPISKQVISLDGGKYLMTNDKGEVSFTISFDESKENEEGNSFFIGINGNSFIISNLNPEEKDITLFYDKEKDEIIKSDGISGEISNQSIIKSTNYKLLLFFGFFTLIIFTVFFLTQLNYQKIMVKDVTHY